MIGPSLRTDSLTTVGQYVLRGNQSVANASSATCARQRKYDMKTVLKYVRLYRASILFVLAMTVAWEMIVRIGGIERFILPAPSLVFETLVTRWSLLFYHAQITFLEVIGGFTLGVTVALPSILLVMIPLESV